MNRGPKRLISSVRIFSILALVGIVGTLFAQDSARRAKPRQFDPTVTSTIFFDDVFAEALQGDRPEALSENRQMIAGSGAGGAAAMDPAASAGSGGSTEWDALITSTTLQDEVKRISNHLQDSLANIRRFNGGGYNDARLHFTELALLFHVIGNYQGEVRWKDNALVARDRFARAGSNLKTATDNTFKEAKDRAEDLANLLRGSSIRLASFGK
jgi:hypothetical protein